MEGLVEQIRKAYRMMAKQARYRPAAPSDGFGNITGRLNLEGEATAYAIQWWEEEDSCTFHIGCCDFATRPETIFAIEAARQLCSGNTGRATALRLLKLAVAALETNINSPGHKAIMSKLGGSR